MQNKNKRKKNYHTCWLPWLRLSQPTNQQVDLTQPKPHKQTVLLFSIKILFKKKR